MYIYVVYIAYKFLQCKAEGLPRCRRMTDAFIGSSKAALKNLIAAEMVTDSEDPYTSFSEGLLNFHEHYCVDDHSSDWCWHEKVRSKNRGFLQ